MVLGFNRDYGPIPRGITEYKINRLSRYTFHRCKSQKILNVVQKAKYTAVRKY